MSRFDVTYEPHAIRYRPRLRRWEASAYLADVFGITVAPATLAKFASVGGGPAITYFATTPLYALGDLDTWAYSKLHVPAHSTSETPLLQVSDTLDDLEP